MTDAAVKGQVGATAAEIYDAFFVPALFAQFAVPLCQAAGLKPGDRVLDIACGTGAATREALTAVAPGGEVTGLDCNRGMLAVARQKVPGARFCEGAAERLPFDDAQFDAALCQFALMFFEDRAAALGEASRVVRPGGRVAFAVWDRVGHSTGYAGMIALLERMFGPKVADALRAPFVLGDRVQLEQLLVESGLGAARITTRPGTARFASIADWVHTDVRGWTLSDMIDEDQFTALLAAAEDEFASLVGADGGLSFAAPAHLVSWVVPGHPGG